MVEPCPIRSPSHSHHLQALGRARAENALPAVSAPPGASGSQNNQSKPVSKSSNATVSGSGRRKLLAESCLYTGFAGQQFLFNFDVCPYTEGGRSTRCCDRGSNFGKCIPRNVRPQSGG